MREAKKMRKDFCLHINEMQKSYYGLLAAVAVLLLLFAVPVMAQSKGEPVVVKSSSSFEVTTKRLKDAIKGKGLNIVFEANHQNMMKMVGIQSKKSITIGFAKPQMAAKFLQIEPRAALEMPMRITVRELDNGSIVVIYYRPSYLFAHYGKKKLTMMAKKRMDPMIEKFVKVAAK